MTTLVLLAVSTQGAKAFEYWIMGDLAQTSGKKWTAADCKNDANKFTANGSIWTYTFTAENSTVLYFRIAAGEGYQNGEMLYPKDGASFTMSEETTYGVGYTISTDKSWGINVTAGQSYEITLDETDTSNRKISYKKAAAQVKFVLNIGGATSSENTDGKFSLDLTSATADKTITFTVNGESYGLSAPATISDAGTTTWSFENGKTNALTLSKGLSYALTLTPATRAAKASTAASVYTLTVVATLPTFDDYYLVGRLYSSDLSAWSDNNADGLKFTSTDGKIYTRSVLCSADNSNFAFRIGESGGKQLIPNGVEIAPQKVATGNITEVDKAESNNCWKLPITKNNLYTFILDMTDKANPTLRYEVEAVSGEYEMVATCGTETLVLPLSEARYRQQNPGDEPALDDNLWTVGFKDDQLEGKKGDVYQVYIRMKGTDKITFRPNETTSGYGNFDRAMGNSYVDDLKLDVSNLIYFGNAKYAETTSGSTNTFSITKGDGQSYMFMLNLGGEIQAGSCPEEAKRNQNISFSHAAQSVSLFVYTSLSSVYKKLYDTKINDGKYDEATQDYYLIGKVNGDEYSTKKVETGTANNKMVRKVYLNPLTNAVDSVVYSKIVRKRTDGFKEIFLSFIPAFFYNTDFYDGALKDGGSNSNKNAWNYVARAATFDEKDTTAPFGTVMVRGVDGGGTGDYYTGTYVNGEQAINPLVSETSGYEYYIIRFNATTSTYRLEFVNNPTIKVKRIQTFCNRADLKLKAGMHAYAVHGFHAGSASKNYMQGKLELRSLKYIPSNEPVVLYCDGVSADGEEDIQFDIITDADEGTQVTDEKEKWWDQSGNAYEPTYNREYGKYKNYLVASLYGTTIENGVWTMDGDKYDYKARNFALNKFFNTKYYKNLPDEEKNTLTDYYSFFRAKGFVPEGRAYLQLPSDVLTFDGQLLDHMEDDEANFAKMSLFFDDLGGDITGIQEVNGTVAPREDGAYYTLQGMKVEKPVKGLYIHNGKKVIIK